MCIENVIYYDCTIEFYWAKFASLNVTNTVVISFTTQVNNADVLVKRKGHKLLKLLVEYRKYPFGPTLSLKSRWHAELLAERQIEKK